MADTTRDPLPQILAALEAIANAVTRGTDVLTDKVDPAARPPTPEQSTAILDYLVLREMAGRRADERQRIVTAARYPSHVIVFPSAIPATATKVAVFSRRRAQPDEVADIGSPAPVRKAGGSTSLGIVLTVVQDTEPIVRLELRQANDLAVALGPRLQAV